MATRNIEMNYYNGSSYDQLYPRTTWSQILNAPSIDTNISYSDINGTVPTSDLPTIPINKGGTNGTSASAGLYNLFSGLSTTSSLSSSYYFPLQYGTSARKITVSNLLSYIESNINVGSGSNVKLVVNTDYTGTGNATTISWLSGTTSTDRNNICFAIITAESPMPEDYPTIGIATSGRDKNSTSTGFYWFGIYWNNAATVIRTGDSTNAITSSGFKVHKNFNVNNILYHCTIFAYVS